MTDKGLAVLRGLLSSTAAGSISDVVSARDSGQRADRYDEIRQLCKDAGIAFHDGRSVPSLCVDHALAVSWRWMIHGIPNLITLHDSLLPKYRGFAPLPNALINGEPETGVTAIFASDDYDTGDIICQKRVSLDYPIKVQAAIDRIVPLYAGIAVEICSALLTGAPLDRIRQDESNATYSLWRDELDYEIDWSGDAARIQRFVDALGHPYQGAATSLQSERVIVHGAVAEADVRIENRTAGKVIFIRDGQPVVVCGSGLLRITEMTTPDGMSVLPLKKFRSRFGQ